MPEVVWHGCAVEILRAARGIEPAAIVPTVNRAVAPLSLDVEVYLVDREQRALRPLPGGRDRHAHDIDTTVAGRCFTTQQTVRPRRAPDRLWVPLVEGSERLGAAQIRLPPGLRATDQGVRAGAEAVATAVSFLVVGMSAYGDTIRRVRRSRHMSTGGELLWRALPPLTFATSAVSVAAALEPCYDVGGDAFDYSLDEGVLWIGIFDAVGHGLTAALTSTLTLAATRCARAARKDLAAMAEAADTAIIDQFGETRYTTAILAQLDSATGVVRYVTAGHPPATVIRGSKAVTSLDAALRPPLGIPARSPVGEHALEPGDRLLFYTDGITDARNARGEFFGLGRLLDLAERHTTSGLTLAETVRRLEFAVQDHQDGPLPDDATLMVVSWDSPP